MRATTPMLAWLALGLAGCATSDLDGQPGGAVALAFEAWRDDELRCGWLQKDCADWYRLEVPERGDVVVSWRSTEGSAEQPPGELIATDSQGRVVGSPVGAAGDRTLAWKADSGAYLVGVKTAGGAARYRIRAEFSPEPPPPPPPPPPPEPRFRRLPSEVLEVEGTPGQPRAVLLDRGRGDGVASGQRGRLLDGERAIAPLRVVDVYDEGCRAMIDGSLESSITPSTTAEIEIPMGE